MIMNFWKVLMESITAKQQQKGRNVYMGTQWFDVSQDTSKVVVPMVAPSQLGKEVGVQGDTMAQTQVSREGQAVVPAQSDGEDITQLSVQAKDLVESESDQGNSISALSGAVHCAVEAFARFGRADMLAQLVKEYPVHKEIEYLVGSLGDFSEAAPFFKKGGSLDLSRIP